MPYGSNSELPSAARDYSDHCQSVFRRVFNETHANTGDEGRAFATAHAAAKKCQEARKSMPDANAVEQAANPKSAQFKIFSGALTPFDGGDGRKRLRTIASSSVEDLGGDVVTAEALKRMAESAKGMTIFRNHSYKVPQDILGTVEKAEVKQSGIDGNQKPIHDLILDVVVMDTPDNNQTHKAVEDGVQLGTSIGAMIPPNGVRRGDNGGYIFDDLRLLEASIVGIPQNPRSWVQYAASAIKKVEEEDDTDTNEEFHASTEVSVGDGGPETVTATFPPEVEKGTMWAETKPDGSVKVTVQTNEVPEKGDETKKETDPEVTKDHVEDDSLDDRDWANLPEGNQAEADQLYAELDEIEKAADPDLVFAPLSSEARTNLKDSDFACPEKRKYPIHDKAHIRNALARCGDASNDQCGCGKVRAAARAAGVGTEKDWGPVLTKEADLTNESSDDPAHAKDETGEETPAQELGESAPESAETPATEDETSDADAALHETVTRSADVLADLVKSMTRERVSLLKQVKDAEAERDTARQQAKDAEANLRVAKEIVQRIANSPLGRKAVYREAVDDFNVRMSPIYGPEILKKLEKNNDAD